MGLVIGAIFVTYTSWPWVFYFAAIVSFIVGLSGLVFIPKLNRDDDGHGSRLRRLDVFGVFLFTGPCTPQSVLRSSSQTHLHFVAASIMFIFAVTSGGSDGWKSARVLAPLIISIGLLVAFFVWESRLPESYAAVYVVALSVFHSYSTTVVFKTFEDLED
jgi:MFS family permease